MLPGFCQIIMLSGLPHENAAVVIRSVISRCVCLSVCLGVSSVHAVTFESLYLETLFLIRRYIFRVFRSSSNVKVIESRSSSQEQKHGIYKIM